MRLTLQNRYLAATILPNFVFNICFKINEKRIQNQSPPCQESGFAERELNFSHSHSWIWSYREPVTIVQLI